VELRDFNVPTFVLLQVMALKESSLIREAERRVLSQENIQNKENRLGGSPFGRGGGRPPPAAGGRDFDGPEQHGGGKPPPGSSLFELEMPRDGGRVISPHKNDLPMADPADLAEVARNPLKSMNIDGLPRHLRHYGDVTTVVLEDDKICELSFHSEPEPRRVILDDGAQVLYCPLNAVAATEFKLAGVTHRLRLGAPSRELWLDGEPYDCYFGRKIKVKIDNGWHSLLIDGPPPSVKIGAPRPDLCRGRVFLLPDGRVDQRIPIYLDRKPQLLEVRGKPHVLRFVDEGFRTLTINGHPFRTDFGGFPMVISVGGQKHYLRLTDLPPSIRLPDAAAEPKQQPATLSPKREPGMGTYVYFLNAVIS
jgi:hypothetical protein